MYRFTGFFARPATECPAKLPAEAIWRAIASPFVGVGVSLPSLADNDDPGPDEAQRLLAEVGLEGSADWLFINYVTWAGRIDSVYGLGSSNDREFGPLRKSDLDKVQAVYLELMSAFGVAAADALKFPPFVRGFWASSPDADPSHTGGAVLLLFLGSWIIQYRHKIPD